MLKDIKKKDKKPKEPVSLKKLILTGVLLLVAPYAYLMLCGLIFDTWLKMYDAVLFIFYSLVTFYAVDIIILVVLIAKYVRQQKRKGGKA